MQRFKPFNRSASIHFAWVALLIQSPAIAQQPKLPFGPAERDRLLTMCELGRQAQDVGKADDAKKIARMMIESTPFEEAAMYQCQTYMVDYLRNPKNSTHLRIKRLADQAQAKK